MDGGYIKLHRSILDWEWYSDANTFRVFLHLVLRASYKETRFKGHEIKRGQTVISNERIGSDLGLTVQQVKTSLKKLIATQSVTCSKIGKHRIITIENYEKFQTATQFATSKQPQNNLEITSKQPSYNNIRNKERKNYNSTQKRNRDASYDIEELMVIK